MNLIKRYSFVCISALLLGVSISACDSGTGPDDTTLPEFSSIAAPGDSAHAYLSSDQFSTLSLEIDYMHGYKPSEQALDSLKSFLQQRLNKSTINIESRTQIESGGQDSYDTEDIYDLEKKNRDHLTTVDSENGNTLWVYFIFVDGKFKDNQNVLGVTYLNTSMAFFGPTIQNNSGGVTQPPRYKLEATVFDHEFGHNLGLVANGSPMQHDHQDEAHGKHCTNDQCLMYYAVETTDYVSNLADGSIPTLDADCRADLQANGGK